VENNINIFDFDYPFFDEAKKLVFQNRFTEHFYFREIGQKPIGKFLHYLKVTFNERLPYYNELFSLAKLEYDKISNYNITETISKVNSMNSNSESESSSTTNGGGTNSNERKFLETPQGKATAIDLYLTSVDRDSGTVSSNSTGNGTSSSTSTANGQETNSRNTKGNINMTPSEVLKKHIEIQNIILNAERSFFEECEDLFMLLY
jgi:hypothetical protein